MRTHARTSTHTHPHTHTNTYAHPHPHEPTHTCRTNPQHCGSASAARAASSTVIVPDVLFEISLPSKTGSATARTHLHYREGVGWVGRSRREGGCMDKGRTEAESTSLYAVSNTKASHARTHARTRTYTYTLTPPLPTHLIHNIHRLYFSLPPSFAHPQHLTTRTHSRQFLRHLAREEIGKVIAAVMKPLPPPFCPPSSMAIRGGCHAWRFPRGHHGTPWRVDDRSSTSSAGVCLRVAQEAGDGHPVEAPRQFAMVFDEGGIWVGNIPTARPRM